MNENQSGSIGLAELIEQVKQELLSTCTYGEPGSDVPVFFVDSVELEIQVSVRREGTGQIKLGVLSFGAEAGGGLSRDDVHTVKVSLSSLFSKDRILEFYQALHSDQVPGTVKASLTSLLKGQERNLNEQF